MKASKLQWTETYGVCCSGGGVKLRNWRCGGDGGGVKTRRSEFFVVADGLFDNASHARQQHHRNCNNSRSVSQLSQLKTKAPSNHHLTG